MCFLIPCFSSFPCLCFCLLSVKFRVNPWQMLMLSCPTVAYASGSECSVLFPWRFVLLLSVSLLLSFPCNSVLIRGYAYASAWSSFRVSASVFSVKFRGNASACSSLRGYYFRDFLKLCYILWDRATPFS